MTSRLKSVAATAKIADGPLHLKSLTLAAGSDTATVIIDDSTDGSGTDILELSAAANTTARWVSGDKDGVYIATALYATITGTSPAVAAEYET